MELEIMYKELIILVFIIVIVLLLGVKKGESKYTKGVVVANTKYVKNTKYYKRLLFKYRIYKILIKVFCIFLIFLCTILTARYHSFYSVGEEVSNRDIMLCMDISGSVNNLNNNLVKTMKKTVSELKNERFGITVFDSNPFSLVPLTTDYQYVISMLDKVEEALKTKYNPFSPNTSSYKRDFLYAGVQNTGDSNRGFSLVGDGLAYCASSFNKDDKRTKIIILTTDNEVIGEQLVDIGEATNYCRNNNIKIYSIGTEEIFDTSKDELVSISKLTNGKYYDFKDYSTDDISNEINKLSKSSITKVNYTYTRDYPEKIIPFILVLLPVLVLLDWRVKI